MEGQRTIETTDLDRFPPTVSDHTNMVDGMRLHTIDPDEDRDIDLFDDERQPRFVGDTDESDEESE